MTQQEILEYNKRCAEFLGWKYIEDGDSWIPPKTTFSQFYTFSSNLKFHSDWNWIMEIVHAIEGLKYLPGERSVLDEFRIESFQVVVRAWITPKHKFYKIISCEPDTKKEAVVQAINQFLIWYKENKKL